MRILYVTHQFFPYFLTGVERNTHNLARQMRLLGHDTLVLSSVPPSLEASGEPRSYVYEGTEVLQLAPRRRTGELPDPEEDPEARAEIERVIHDYRPDVVHVVHARYFPEARHVASGLGIPTVAHLHDYWYICPRIQLLRPDGSTCKGSNWGSDCESACGMSVQWGRDRHLWARRELAGYDAVIFPSRFLANRFAEEGVDVGGWHHVPYGVDYRTLASSARPPDSFAKGGRANASSRRPESPSPNVRGPRPRRFTARRPMVVRFIGTLLRHKGPHVLIEAVKRVSEEAPLMVYLHGPSYHESDYELELKGLAADDPRIRFAGAYSYSDLGRILADTDLVVVPSLWPENFPITAQTATALDVPVAASDTGGLAELVHDYSAGFTFPPGDPDALAAIITACLSDPRRLSLPADRLRPPSLEEEAVTVERVYTEVLR